MIESEASLQALLARAARAEERLEKLRERWPGVLFDQRCDLTVSFANRNLEEITGINTAAWKGDPQTIWRVLHEGDVDEFRRLLARMNRDKQPSSCTFRIRNAKTGRVVYVEEHRSPVLDEGGGLTGYEAVWLDVTRQAVAEKRLSSAAWKETLAVLTMGLAHDFSNIMAGILSLSEAFEAQMEKEHPFQEGLALIKRNSKQASQLVHRIMSLHQGKTGERNYFNLNDLVVEMVELVRKIIPRRIEIATDLTARQLPVFIDAVEFRQVLVNLTLNAADAMPQGGKLLFRTLRADQAITAGGPEGPRRSPSAWLQVADSGMGIPARHLASLFDPFFTTKGVNKGSGLGLYNARLFAEKHHGRIWAESKEDQGATFHIVLPEADFTEAERLAATPPKQRKTLMILGSPSEKPDHIVELLRENGYYVVAPECEAEALELLACSEFSFSGVLFLAGREDPAPASILGELKKQTPPLKTVLHVVGCNPDEINTELLNRMDLVIPADTSGPALLSRLNSVLESASSAA